MNSDNLILRETTFPPLVNKNDFLNSAEFDANFINIYEDLVALCSTTGVIEFDEGTTYDDSINQFASFDGRLYRWIDTAPGAGVTPGTEGASEYWSEIFPTDLAHRKNSDEFLAEGTADEVSASEIRAFIDAGLTTTTDLSITEKTGTSFKLNSSTGADVTIPAATSSEAGLLTAGDKVKLQRLSGTNTGDQTLESLGAETVSNKVTDFSTLNDELYPSVQATETRIGERIDELKGSPPAELDTLEKMASAIANPTRMTTLGKNATGSTLYKGTVVYINGASGGVPTFAKAKADSEATSSRTLGVILADISNLGEGYAVTLGDVDSLDTRTAAANPFTSDTLAVGDQLYLSPTTAGYVTNVKPTAPNHIVYIGKVLNTGTNDGEILFQIQNGYELEELHNVKAGATDGQYLKWVASSGLWEPTTLSNNGVCGIANSSGVYTFYSTLAAAITAATSGQTIELFADVTETGAVQLNLKNGVNINFNGHTYTLNNAGTSNAFSDNNAAVSCKLMNGLVVRSGGTSSETDSQPLYVDNTSSIIECYGMKFSSTFSYGCINEGTVYGGEFSGLIGFYCRSGVAYNIVGRGTTSRGIRNLAKCIKCTGISTGSDGIYSSGTLVDCYGFSSGAYGGYFEGGSVFNSSFHSSFGFGVGVISGATNFENCTFFSSAGAGFYAQAAVYLLNCTGYSTSSHGLWVFNAESYIENCVGFSSVNNGIRSGSLVTLKNCSAQSLGAAAIHTQGKVYKSTAFSNWNNASGHAITGDTTSFSEIFGCYLETLNASANCLYYGSAINVKFAQNIYKGSTTPINANITQTQTNTPDSFGNIKIG